MLNINIPNESQRRRRRRRSRAFTIVELLISIAVIAILIGVALYGLRAARRSAGRTTTMNAMRQMMVAYNSYTNDHDGRLMPGYLDAATVVQLGIKARLQNGEPLNDTDAGSYVWRLAPYLDHQWLLFMADYQSTDLNNRFLNEHASGIYGPGTGAIATNLCISSRPSFGLNSVYLGGDSVHGDPATNPWADPDTLNPLRVAALRMAEIKSPAKIIVFAPTRGIGPELTAMPSIVPLGYAHLAPPFTGFNKNTQQPENLQWQFDAAVPDQDHIVYLGSATLAGVPIDRYGGNKVSISHLDGSVTTESIESLGPSANNQNTLMSRWSPFAVGFQ